MGSLSFKSYNKKYRSSYTRLRDESSGEWSSWCKTYSENSKPTAKMLVLTIGGTLTGSIHTSNSTKGGLKQTLSKVQEPKNSFLYYSNIIRVGRQTLKCFYLGKTNPKVSNWSTTYFFS